MVSKRFKITGVCPLLMHNGQMANPLNPYAKALKAISGKRNKTDADHEEMAHIEFLASLYLNEDGDPCIPSSNIRGMLLGKGGASRKRKLGKEAQLAMFVSGDYPLLYDGPRDPEELWKDEEFRFAQMLTVQTSKVLRTRPIFKEWSSEVEVFYNPDYIENDMVEYLVGLGGAEVGIMDWRPTYGRFNVEVIG